jgi:Fic family protein
MKQSDFTENRSGEFVNIGQDCWAFVPAPLPPKLELSWGLVAALSEAQRAIATLEGLGRILPNPELLIRPFMKNEAVLSSRIEGTQASLSDLFFFEAVDRPNNPGRHEFNDVSEVQNYFKAMEYGFLRLEELPVSLRLIREIHKTLMKGVRGKNRSPGAFRKIQNWIGPAGCPLTQSTYTPPPVPQMLKALNDLEVFLNSPSTLPTLIRLAIVHYQFEAIHPFLDGNGRIGRLLISLLLHSEKLLSRPLLYFSAYFERNRRSYYELLLRVSANGEWDKWILFFLEGLATQSVEAAATAEALLIHQKDYKTRVRSGKGAASALRLIDMLFDTPIISVPMAASYLGVTYKSALNGLSGLTKLGILEEMSINARPKLFRAKEIIELIWSGDLPVRP